MASADPSEGASGLLAGTTGHWTLDPSATTIELQTKAMWGLVKVKGSVKALAGEGTVTEDGGVQGSLTIDASSLDTGNQKRDKHLRSSDFLESDKHPTMTYTATSASATGDGGITLTGTLTVHGETRPLNITANVAQTAPDRAHLTSEFDIDRSAWGLTWAKMGAKLSNQLVVHAQFTKD